MNRGNVLVIGNSGVGKSTLINAALGEARAEVGWGPVGTTRELHIYAAEGLPFRVIDTVGFEPSFLKERQAIGAVKKWSRTAARADGNGAINVICGFLVTYRMLEMFRTKPAPKKDGEEAK